LGRTTNGCGAGGTVAAGVAGTIDGASLAPQLPESMSRGRAGPGSQWKGGAKVGETGVSLIAGRGRGAVVDAPAVSLNGAAGGREAIEAETDARPVVAGKGGGIRWANHVPIPAVRASNKPRRTQALQASRASAPGRV
jgi:hypothetical protein